MTIKYKSHLNNFTVFLEMVGIDDDENETDYKLELNIFTKQETNYVKIIDENMWIVDSGNFCHMCHR